jgi:hypothetical protein
MDKVEMKQELLKYRLESLHQFMSRLDHFSSLRLPSLRLPGIRRDAVEEQFKVFVGEYLNALSERQLEKKTEG